MERDYKRIIDKLNNYKNTHPNFYNLWAHYLRIKKENFRQDLINCSKVIERLETQNDITPENLITLLILNNSYHLNTNV